MIEQFGCKDILEESASATTTREAPMQKRKTKRTGARRKTQRRQVLGQFSMRAIWLRKKKGHHGKYLAANYLRHHNLMEFYFRDAETVAEALGSVLEKRYGWRDEEFR